MQKLTNAELGRPSLEVYRQTEKFPITIILDNVRSALNVGSVFRTADAFNIESIFLCGITALPPHKEVLKTALGATESVNWNYFNQTLDAINALREKNYEIFAIEQTRESLPLHQVNFATKKVALVFGHEMDGVQQAVIDNCNGTIEIPQVGIKHSLNISVCVGILCWEYFRQNC